MTTPSVTLSQLESHLWEAANILRGPVDGADFKTYVFPLLFFKRISDVRDEEYRAALAESGGDEEYAQFPQNYRFQIPDDCHWLMVNILDPKEGESIYDPTCGTGGMLLEGIHHVKEICLDLLNTGLRGPDQAAALRDWEGFCRP